MNNEAQAEVTFAWAFLFDLTRLVQSVYYVVFLRKG